MVAPARQFALRALRRVQEGDVDLASALDHSRRELDDDRDKALAAEIILGTLRWRGALDHAISWAGQRAPGAFDAVVLDILRLSAYQLLHLDRVPAAAVVDDAVDLCKSQGLRSASRAVNAILRRISRDRGRLPMPGPEDALAHLSVTWSHPAWLAARWLDRLGFDAALAWVRFNNSPAPMTLRVNTSQIDRSGLAEALAADGVLTRPCTYAPDGLVVESGNPIRSSREHAGLFAVQDEASQVVGAFVAPVRGACVVDACAAPGGKTAQLAAALGSTGLLVACDLRPRRIRLLRSALREGQVNRVAIVQHDLLRGAPFRNVDTILVDAPCSGLGTIRRDPDIRWKRTGGDLPVFADRQQRMLDQAAASVRAGGCLVYSTCSSEPEENEDVVHAFLEQHPDFSVEDPRRVPAGVPGAVLPCLDPSGFLRTTPPVHGLEAFFAARLRRRP